MQYDEFIGQVQHQAHLASREDAVRAIRATLETLGERLFGNEADHLAAQLPREIAYYLTNARQRESFGLDEFFQRVQEREGVSVELPEAIYHARVVLSVLQDAVSPGEIADIRAQLPHEFQPIFDARAEGALPRVG